jgi:hypothetical protein
MSNPISWFYKAVYLSGQRQALSTTVKHGLEAHAKFTAHKSDKSETQVLSGLLTGLTEETVQLQELVSSIITVNGWGKTLGRVWFKDSKIALIKELLAEQLLKNESALHLSKEEIAKTKMSPLAFERMTREARKEMGVDNPSNSCLLTANKVVQFWKSVRELATDLHTPKASRVTELNDFRVGFELQVLIDYVKSADPDPTKLLPFQKDLLVGVANHLRAQKGAPPIAASAKTFTPESPLEHSLVAACASSNLVLFRMADFYAEHFNVTDIRYRKASIAPGGMMRVLPNGTENEIIFGSAGRGTITLEGGFQVELIDPAARDLTNRVSSMKDVTFITQNKEGEEVETTRLNTKEAPHIGGRERNTGSFAQTTPQSSYNYSIGILEKLRQYSTVSGDFDRDLNEHLQLGFTQVGYGMTPQCALNFASVNRYTIAAGGVSVKLRNVDNKKFVFSYTKSSDITPLEQPMKRDSEGKLLNDDEGNPIPDALGKTITFWEYEIVRNGKGQWEPRVTTIRNDLILLYGDHNDCFINSQWAHPVKEENKAEK